MIQLSAYVPQEDAFAAGGGATSTEAWTYSIADTSTVGDVVATSPSYAVREGQSPQLSLSVKVPTSGDPVDLVITYAYMDLAGDVLASGDVGGVFTATTVAAVRTVTPPPVPAGARSWVAMIRLSEGVSEVVLRVNEISNPAADSGGLTVLSARNSWTYSSHPSTDVPIPGLPGRFRVQCATAGAGTNRGFNHYYGGIDGTAQGYRVDVAEGDIFTVSGYMKSAATAGGTLAAAVRFTYYDGYNAASWVGSAVYGAAVTGSTTEWVRVSVTATVPAGANGIGISFLRTDSFAWQVGDQILLTGILIEKTDQLRPFFSGYYSPDASLVRWWGSPAYSRSEMYVPGEPRGRTIVLADTSLYVEVHPEEFLAATLTRPLRRSVYDALNVPAPQISIGTPGLLAGTLTYLCASLAEALSLDGLYQFAGPITLETGGALDGFTHMAVESLRMTAERATPGQPSKWLTAVEVREVRE